MAGLPAGWAVVWARDVSHSDPISDIHWVSILLCRTPWRSRRDLGVALHHPSFPLAPAVVAACSMRISVKTLPRQHRKFSCLAKASRAREQQQQQQEQCSRQPLEKQGRPSDGTREDLEGGEVTRLARTAEPPDSESRLSGFFGQGDREFSMETGKEALLEFVRLV